MSVSRRKIGKMDSANFSSTATQRRRHVLIEFLSVGGGSGSFFLWTRKGPNG